MAGADRAASRLLFVVGRLESEPVLENGVVSPLLTAADFRIADAELCCVVWFENCVEEVDDEDDISMMTRRRVAGESV